MKTYKWDFYVGLFMVAVAVVTLYLMHKYWTLYIESAVKNMMP